MMARRKRRLPPHPVESFDSLFDRMKPIIVGYSFNKRVFGMTPDEVQSEMFQCLWDAWHTFDPDIPDQTMTKRFWAMWQHRHVDLIRYNMAKFRGRNRESTFSAYDLSPEDIEALAPLFHMEDIPECPSADPEARNVWTLIAFGCNWADVVELLGISKRRYYTLVNGWRSDPEVRALLFA